MQFTQNELYMLINLTSKALWLVGADLRDASLMDADLRGADLRQANLREAYLGEASLNEDTILPDGTKWMPETDMTRFTGTQQEDED